MRAWGLALCLLTLAGCYRLASPPQINETVRIEVVSNQGRMVRSQAYLVEALTNAMVRELGWRVTPTGSAVLQISIAEEINGISAEDTRGVPSQWRARLRGQALLTWRGGSVAMDWTGEGTNQNLGDEPEALAQAAKNAAASLVAWIDAKGDEIK